MTSPSTQKKVGVGVGVMILRDGKVLLGQRNVDPAKASSRLAGAGTWTMPGGKLEFGETILQCAARETKEETGLEIINPTLIALNEDMVTDAHFITIGVLVNDIRGEVQNCEPDKITEWIWFPLDKLPSPLYFPSEKILNNYQKKQFFITAK